MLFLNSKIQALKTEEISEIDKTEKEIESISEEIESNSGAIRLIEQQSMELEQEIAKLGNQLVQIQTKLPILNDQKSVAVSLRNFKEAAIIAKQLNDALDKKNEIISDLEIKDKLKELQTLLEDYKLRNNKLDHKLDRTLKNLNQKKLDYTKLQISEYRNVSKKINEAGPTGEKTLGGLLSLIIETNRSMCQQESEMISEILSNKQSETNVDEYEVNSNSEGTQNLKTLDSQSQLSIDKEEIVENCFSNSDSEKDKLPPKFIKQIAIPTVELFIPFKEKTEEERKIIENNAHYYEDLLSNLFEIEQSLACSIEEENYELADILDQKLNTIKSLLSQLSTSE